MQLVFWLVKDLATTIVMFSLMGFLMGPFFAAVGYFLFQYSSFSNFFFHGLTWKTLIKLTVII